MHPLSLNLLNKGFNTCLKLAGIIGGIVAFNGHEGDTALVTNFFQLDRFDIVGVAELQAVIDDPLSAGPRPKIQSRRCLPLLLSGGDMEFIPSNI